MWCLRVMRRHAQVTRAVWEYIKKNNLNQGRTIKPDAKLKKVFPVAQSARASIAYGSFVHIGHIPGCA